MTGSAQAEAERDICVYGGTSAGVIAAVQAKKMGKSVILVSPSRHVGGMTSGGLGFADIGLARTVGGLSREFFHRAWRHYNDPQAWTWQTRESFPNQGQHGPAFDAAREIATVFEPHVAEEIFRAMLAESGVEVITARLDLKDGVEKKDNRIVALRTEDGRRFPAREYIDATYEGDLMAAAGVSSTTGREANAKYGETADGIQPGGGGNRLPEGIDPYVKRGDAGSGLLPRVNGNAGGAKGDGDDKIQAYCYRLCLTDVPENRAPIGKPEGYREEDYELLFRAIEAGQTTKFLKLSSLPNRKTDSNNASGLSMDFIGGNHGYPESDYATREKIARAHELWQRGLIWTLQNHPRVPASIRSSLAKWGLAKDEFTDNGNWPTELYVREARRMVNDHVIDEEAVMKRTTDEPVGIGSYKMDSHNTQYYVNEKGWVTTEGDVQKAPNGPYEIDYRALTPRERECTNLIVPVCVAASHIAYGSIRMESVFMILGQSAATATVQAIEEGVPVQRIDYPKLRQRLETDGQVVDILSIGKDLSRDRYRVRTRVSRKLRKAAEGLFATVAKA